jgi:hypothetical protein
LASDELRAITENEEGSRAIGQVTLPFLECDGSLCASFGVADEVGEEDLEELLLYNSTCSSSHCMAEDLSRCSSQGLPMSCMSLDTHSQASSSALNNFPPLLSREQSDILDRLLPDGDFWRSPTAGDSLHPLHLMRGISWDVYNGSFGEDLVAIFNN